MTDKLKFYLPGSEFNISEQAKIARKDPDLHNSLVVQAKAENSRIIAAKARRANILATYRMKERKDLEMRFLRSSPKTENESQSKRLKKRRKK